MLGHPIYTGALLLGALVFTVYCYYTHEGRRNTSHQYQRRRGSTSYQCQPRRGSPAPSSNFNESSTAECIICINTCEGPIQTLRCNHSFHSGCINQWFAQGRSCPICRQR